MRWSPLFAVVLAGCPGGDDAGTRVDAGSTDRPDAPADATSACVPDTPEPPPACLALSPGELRGTTPFGALDLDLDYVGAGDCITISSATITFAGACGESLRIQFSYPVTTIESGRAVTSSFETDARFWFQRPDAALADTVGRVRVEVVTWREGESMHDIDISLTILDERFAIGSPIHIQGTFCDWPYYLC